MNKDTQIKQIKSRQSAEGEARSTDFQALAKLQQKNDEKRQ